MEPDDAIVILLGAGAGRRLGAAEPKVLLPIGGRPMLAIAAGAAAVSAPVRGLVVTFPAGWQGRARACVDDLGVPVRLVEGGGSRQASVRAALAEIPETAGIVAVHDAARPFAPPDLFARVLEAVKEGADGAVPVLPVTDTVLRVRGALVEGAEPREELTLGQTPQAFRTSVLREAHAKAEAAGASFTDDASILRWAGFDVHAVPGDPANVKITTLADLAEAERRMGGGGG
ncbi:MAG TPA: 2-C-methyl-D-erythritol 4-phosphate cytidylyltransferase [Actinomycetota bacterium]|nr:2-C-methyl-D-erythritol 4-phosphate cytidylyltransferase [Actinomycetota bacterium]